MVSVTHLNNYLGTIMPDLTVKTFRTYRSSQIMADSVKYLKKKNNKDIPDK